jgi:hypothetical protein
LICKAQNFNSRAQSAEEARKPGDTQLDVPPGRAGQQTAAERGLLIRSRLPRRRFDALENLGIG